MKVSRQLKFRDDGTFVIAQFTDVELIDEFDYDPKSPELDQATLNLMEMVIQTEKPDLVVFTGDLIASARTRDPIHSFRRAVSVAEKNEVPWAAVFGNHDSEGSVSRQAMHQLQLEHKFNVAKEDPPGVSGAGNYALTVTNSNNEAKAALYFLDSGDYAEIGGYDWIKRDQINWYVEQSNTFTNENGGQPLPALAFFHIPLPEYEVAWETQVSYGHRLVTKRRMPALNSGMFAALVEAGDVMGVFVGHNHANDYCSTLHGIRLCYGRSAKYVSYTEKDDFPTGARIIQLTEGDRDFKTWIRQNDGTVIYQQPKHEPEPKQE